MSTIQIAQRLVRNFGEGGKFRQVVTETIGDGKTLTKVLDRDGNVVTERLKFTAPEIKVGDKFVKTTTKVVKGESDGDTLASVHKFVTDRVYDGNGQKIGERLKCWSEEDGLLSKTVTAGDKKLITVFDDGIRDFMKKYLNKNTCGFVPVNCNYKGLPMPSYSTGKDLSNAALKDMRIAFQEAFPGQKYAPDAFRFSSLDEHLPEMKLTDLDKYL